MVEKRKKLIDTGFLRFFLDLDIVLLDVGLLGFSRIFGLIKIEIVINQLLIQK